MTWDVVHIEAPGVVVEARVPSDGSCTFRVCDHGDDVARIVYYPNTFLGIAAEDFSDADAVVTSSFIILAVVALSTIVLGLWLPQVVALVLGLLVGWRGFILGQRVMGIYTTFDAAFGAAVRAARKRVARREDVEARVGRLRGHVDVLRELNNDTRRDL